MPMTHAANQTEIGSKLFLFRSLDGNNTECLIMAHGGYAMGDGQFAVPGGVTVHFYAPHGVALNDPSVMENIQLMKNPVAHDVAAGQNCWNYKLYKVLGRHGGGDSYLDVEMFMDQAHGFMDDVRAGRFAAVDRAGNRRWAPNVVTVRNRTMRDKFVTLQTLITDVRGRLPTITDFHILACRTVFWGATRFGLENRRV